MTDPAERRPARRCSSDLALIIMMGLLAVPLLGGAAYVLFQDLEGEMKGIVAASALLCCAPLGALIIYVLVRPLSEAH